LDISSEFCFHSEVSLVVLFSVVYLFAAIHHRLTIPHVFFFFSGEEPPWLPVLLRLSGHLVVLRLFLGSIAS
jgi:hypothetical protein